MERPGQLVCVSAVCRSPTPRPSAVRPAGPWAGVARGWQGPSTQPRVAPGLSSVPVRTRPRMRAQASRPPAIGLFQSKSPLCCELRPNPQPRRACLGWCRLFYTQGVVQGGRNADAAARAPSCPHVAFQNTCQAVAGRHTCPPLPGLQHRAARCRRPAARQNSQRVRRNLRKAIIACILFAARPCVVAAASALPRHTWRASSRHWR
jgi:hypothetical protein